MTDRPPGSRLSVWDIVRWVAALPAAFVVYVLVPQVLAHLAGLIPASVPGNLAYAAIFALAALAAVYAGAYTAPDHRFLAACALTLVLAGVLTYTVLAAAAYGYDHLAVLPNVLGQIAAALIAVYTLWRAERRDAGRFP